MLPPWLDATYPPAQRAASMLAYLVLLRVEIAAFHSGLNRLVSVALIRTSRWTGVTRYAALCSPDLPPVRPFGGCTSDGLVCFTLALSHAGPYDFGDHAYGRQAGGLAASSAPCPSLQSSEPST